MADEIPGLRKAGELADEATPIPTVIPVESDPRLGEITTEVRQRYQLVFTRGAHGATYEFESEPSDAVKAQYQKLAEETMDALESQPTQELQDRRRPKQ